MPGDQNAEQAKDQPQDQGQQDQPQQDQHRQELPDDHPLVRTLDAQKAEIASLKKAARESAKSMQRLSDLEDAQKSEEQRTADKITKLEDRAVLAEQQVLRLKIGARYSITEDDVGLFLTGTDEETLVKQAERLQQRDANQKNSKLGWKTGEGKQAPPNGDPDLAFVQDFFGQQ